jgi:hypothetical protein
MQAKQDGSDDEDTIYAMFDDAKNLNVYDERYNDYIDRPSDQLGMNQEVEHNFGFHPFNTDYLHLSNLNKEYVRKNQREA